MSIYFPTGTYKLSLTAVKTMNPEIRLSMESAGLDIATVNASDARKLQIMTVDRTAQETGCKGGTLYVHVRMRTVELIPGIGTMKSIDQRREILG